VYVSQWEWIAVSITLASCLCLTVRSTRTRDDRNPAGLILLALLLGCMVAQTIPLPPDVVRFMSPSRWAAAAFARTATGHDLAAWLPLSVAPSATLERLLYVVPAMAAFVAAREMAQWWGGTRTWLTAAPVVLVGALESLLGLAQFSAAEAASGPSPVSGTYVNRNHFAGFIELAIPLPIWGRQVLDKKKKPP
jgi:hypothetical protein